MEKAEILPGIQRTRVLNLAISMAIPVMLALLTNRLAAFSPKALEYPLWAVALGRIANLALSATGVREKVNQAFRTALVLKVGLVLLGAGLNFTQVLSVGAKGGGAGRDHGHCGLSVHRVAGGPVQAGRPATGRDVHGHRDLRGVGG